MLNYQTIYFYNMTILDTFRKVKEHYLSIRKHGYIEHINQQLQTEQLKFRNLNIILRSDIRVASVAIELDGANLEHASDSLKDNKELVLRAIGNNTQSLRYASKRLCDDREIIFAAVSIAGSAIKYASDRLKDDEELILVAINTSTSVCDYINKRQKQNPKIIAHACYHGYLMFKYFDLNLLTDDTLYDIVFKNTDITPNVYHYMTQENKLPDCPELHFIVKNRVCMSMEQWPIIKKALVEHPKEFLNPPIIIKDLTDGEDNQYQLLAQYTLSQVNSLNTDHNAVIPDDLLC